MGQVQTNAKEGAIDWVIGKERRAIRIAFAMLTKYRSSRPRKFSHNGLEAIIVAGMLELAKSVIAN